MSFYSLAVSSVELESSLMGHKFLPDQFLFQVSAKEKLKKGISEKLKRVKSFLILLTILLPS